MLVKLVMVAGVVLVAFPALVLGARGMTRRTGHYSSDLAADRASLIVLVVVRLLTWLLVLLLSGLVLVSAIGALARDVEMPQLVSEFFILDLLLAALILLSFGRRVRRPSRRRANPASR